ncbi:MAG: hypothetical protein IT204_04965 [Fimbriimonadaceae bacterium]|nr:hypothetical protein [Fimbriimonadaceae bacterium]
MSSYPAAPPQRARRVGAVTLLLGLLLTVAAARVQQRRWAWWDWQPPVHSAALSAPTVRSSRLWRWRVWSYATPTTPTAVREFYGRALAAEGWTAGPVQPLRTALVATWQQPPRTVRLRCETDPAGACLVSLLLTDAASLPSELEGRW